MIFRLPLESGNKSNIKVRLSISFLAFFVFSSFILYITYNYFIGYRNSSTFSVDKLILFRENNIPRLLINIRNTSDRSMNAYGELFLEDKTNSNKKQIMLGDLGEIGANDEKEMVVEWKSEWNGAGIGQIQMVVRDQDGNVADKSMYIAVLPTSIKSISLLTFLASSLMGAGYVISRFA